MAPAGSSTRRDDRAISHRLRGAARATWRRSESRRRTACQWRSDSVCAMLGNPATAADIAQTPWSRAWRELPQLPDLTTFDDWFRRIVIDACRMELRRRQAPTPAWYDHPAGAPPVAVDPELARMVGTGDPDHALEAAFRAARSRRAQRCSSSVPWSTGRRPRSRSCCACRPAPPTGTSARRAWRSERTRVRLPGTEPLDELVERLIPPARRRAMPDDLLDRSMHAVAHSDRRGPRRRPPTGPRVGAGRVLLGVALGRRPDRVPTAALLWATGGRLGGRPPATPRRRGCASTAVGAGNRCPRPSAAKRGLPQRQHRLTRPPSSPVPRGLTRAATRCGSARSPTGRRLAQAGSAPAPGHPDVRRGRPVKADNLWTGTLVQVYRGRKPLFGWVASGKDGEAWIRRDPCPVSPSPTSTPWATMLAARVPGLPSAIAHSPSRPTCAAWPRRRSGRPAPSGGEGVCVEGPAWLLPDPECSRRRWTAARGRRARSAPRPARRWCPVPGVDTARPMRLTGSLDAARGRRTAGSPMPRRRSRAARGGRPPVPHPVRGSDAEARSSRLDVARGASARARPAADPGRRGGAAAPPW